jgi:hypothetical protein
MEFDDRLHRSFDALAERLHQEIAAQLKTALNDLSASVGLDRQAAVAEATREARADLEREIDRRLNEAVASTEEQAKSKAEAKGTALSRRLVEAIRAIDAAHSLSEILDVLIVSASAEVSRAAIFFPKGSTLKGWRLVGFDQLGADSPSVDLPFAEGGIIADAGETGRLVRFDSRSTARPLPAFVELPQDRRALAVPLVMTGQVFAVLYVDEGTGQSVAGESWPATVEIFARHAARALEAITATRLAQVTEVVGR